MVVILLVILSISFEVPRYFERELNTVSISNKWIAIDLTYSSYTDLWDNNTYKIIYRTIAMPLLRLILPLVITSVLTSKLVILLMKQRKKRVILVGARNAQKQNETRNTRITFVLVFIAVFFIFTSITACIYPMLDDSELCCSFFNYFATIANMLKVLNSAVNFLIYYTTVPAVRRLLWDIMKCSHCRHTRQGMASNQPIRTTPCFIIFRVEVSAGMVDPQN